MKVKVIKSKVKKDKNNCNINKTDKRNSVCPYSMILNDCALDKVVQYGEHWMNRDSESFKVFDDWTDKLSQVLTELDIALHLDYNKCMARINNLELTGIINPYTSQVRRAQLAEYNEMLLKQQDAILEVYNKIYNDLFYPISKQIQDGYFLVDEDKADTFDRDDYSQFMEDRN